LPSAIEQLHRDLSPRGLSILAVDIQESRTTVAAWAREKRVTFPIVLDTHGEVIGRYGVIATPTVFLIDRQGRLLGRVVGPRDWSTPVARSLIETLLAAPAASDTKTSLGKERRDRAM
jgi:alkyl hydroperoxide reductase subunit AhpC